MGKTSIHGGSGPADGAPFDPPERDLEDAALRRRSFLTTALAGTAGAAALIAPSAATAQDAGRSESVRDYGAVGDGEADDTAAIQRAIDRGATDKHPVFFPPGTYRVTESLRVRDEVDLFGSDASFCRILHDLRGASASHRRANHACLRLENEGEPPGPVKNVLVRHLGFGTTEARADLGDEAREQTGIYAKHAFWNVRIRDAIIADFAIGVNLQDCWTARLLYSSIIRAQVHCVRWENATCGELTGNRLDCISGSRVTGRGKDCVYVSYSTSPPQFFETMALGVTNNSMQASEGAGFRGVGLSNMTFTNNFLENTNRRGDAAAILLETAPAPTGPPGPERRGDRHPLMRVVNLTGGFITPGSHGLGPAVKIGDYFVINIQGLDIRGSRLRRGLHLYGRHSQVNVIGTMSRLENYIRSPHRNIIGSVMRVNDA